MDGSLELKMVVVDEAFFLALFKFDILMVDDVSILLGLEFVGSLNFLESSFLHAVESIHTKWVLIVIRDDFQVLLSSWHSHTLHSLDSSTFGKIWM